MFSPPQYHSLSSPNGLSLYNHALIPYLPKRPFILTTPPRPVSPTPSLSTGSSTSRASRSIPPSPVSDADPPRCAPSSHRPPTPVHPVLHIDTPPNSAYSLDREPHSPSGGDGTRKPPDAPLSAVPSYTSTSLDTDGNGETDMDIMFEFCHQVFDMLEDQGMPLPSPPARPESRLLAPAGATLQRRRGVRGKQTPTSAQLRPRHRRFASSSSCLTNLGQDQDGCDWEKEDYIRSRRNSVASFPYSSLSTAQTVAVEQEPQRGSGDGDEMVSVYINADVLPFVPTPVSQTPLDLQVSMVEASFDVDSMTTPTAVAAPASSASPTESSSSLSTPPTTPPALSTTSLVPRLTRTAPASSLLLSTSPQTLSPTSPLSPYTPLPASPRLTSRWSMSTVGPADQDEILGASQGAEWRNAYKLFSGSGFLRLVGAKGRARSDGTSA